MDKVENTWEVNMKVLIGLSNTNQSKNYKMCIVDVDEIRTENYLKNKWVDLDINQLQACSNVKVDINQYQSISQNPSEYLVAEFHVNKIIDSMYIHDFQITNVYYDEFHQPQLYRSVDSSGRVSMHDISELEYKKETCLSGKTLEELPSFVRKEPISNAYNWWKAKDEAAEKEENSLFSSQFEVNENMPVKLLYHYLIGVKGFQVGYHTATEITDNYTSEIRHEYMLFKDTANIKLEESIPKEQNSYRYYSFGEDNDPYPNKRKIKEYGATMSMICSLEKLPTFDGYHGPISFSAYDDNGIEVTLDYRNGLMHTYNKIEKSGCIQKNWRLGEYLDFFGMTKYNLIPNELALLSARLQSEKEGTFYGHAMSATHGHWSTFSTDGWMKAIGFACSTQYYSPELGQQIMPILNTYQKYYSKNLNDLIEQMGAKDALETMKWTKDNSKNILNTISNIKSDGSIQKSNIHVVDQMSGLFTFQRNRYDLPDWLQIYSPSTIECLGGVDLLKQTISTRGEDMAKKSLSILAEGIEAEQRAKLRRTNDTFIKPGDMIQEEIAEETEVINESTGIRR